MGFRISPRVGVKCCKLAPNFMREPGQTWRNSCGFVGKHGSKMLWIALVSLEHGQNSVEFVCKLCVYWADRMPSPARQQCGDTKACLQMQTACLDSMLFWRKYRGILCRKKQLLTLENRSPAWCLVSRASQSPCSLCSSRHAIINFHKCHCTIDSI